MAGHARERERGHSAILRGNLPQPLRHVADLAASMSEIHGDAPNWCGSYRRPSSTPASTEADAIAAAEYDWPSPHQLAQRHWCRYRGLYLRIGTIGVTLQSYAPGRIFPPGFSDVASKPIQH